MSYLAHRAVSLSFEPFRLALELPPDVLRLTTGEPDFDTPAPVRDAAKRALDAGRTHYTPTAGTLELREAIANKLRRENGARYTASDIVVTSGSSIAVHCTMLALLNRGDEVILPDPAWFHYAALIELCSGKTVTVPLRCQDFTLTAAAVRPKLGRRTRLIVINSPNNPTGSVQDVSELRQICRLARDAGAFILSDENYEKIVFSGARHVSPASLAPQRTIVIGGFSKGYAMTGWRIGYAAAPPTIARRIETLHAFIALGPSSIAQAGAREALTNPAVAEAVQGMVREFEARRDLVVDELGHMDSVSCTKPQGAFYAWINIARLGMRSAEFGRKLAARAKLGLLPGSVFGRQGEGYMRLSFAYSRNSLVEGLRRLRSFVSRS